MCVIFVIDVSCHSAFPVGVARSLLTQTSHRFAPTEAVLVSECLVTEFCGKFCGTVISRNCDV